MSGFETNIFRIQHATAAATADEDDYEDPDLKMDGAKKPVESHP
jgi:hypothetical protein